MHSSVLFSIWSLSGCFSERAGTRSRTNHSVTASDGPSARVRLCNISHMDGREESALGWL